MRVFSSHQSKKFQSVRISKHFDISTSLPRVSPGCDHPGGSSKFFFFLWKVLPNRQHRISANFFPVNCPYKSWPKSVNFGQLFDPKPQKVGRNRLIFFLGPWRDLRLETWETTMERLYGSHNRARPSRIVCQPSDVILWINTPFDTKNFKRKYESLIKLHHFWRWYFLFFGEAVKKN